MTRVRNVLQTLRSHPEHYAPWLYLLACALAYAPLLPQLGFYWDDWPMVLFIHNEQWGQLLTHFSYDRPFSPWPYFIFGQLGTHPMVWHLSMLLMRWLGVVAMAWALKPLWPRQPRFILYIGLLFAVYPGYLAQPSAVTFATQLGTQLAFFLSLGAMGRAASQPERYGRYTLMGLAAGVVHVFTMEYFTGLDLIRPLFLWLIFQRHKLQATRLQIARVVAKQWLPYLAILAAWAIWRFWLLELPEEPYPLELSPSLLETIGLLGRGALGDFWHTLVVVWQETLLPSFWPGWAIAALAAAGFAWLLTRQPNLAEVEPRPQVAWLGIAAFFLGLTPIWVTGNLAHDGDPNSRYLLPGLMGAAMLVCWLLFRVIRSARGRALALALLLGLAVGSHVRNADLFRQDWQAQLNFYWQLHWRAPGLAPGTALMTPDRITDWTGEPLLGAALNTLYPIRSQAPDADLWALELRFSHALDPLLRGEGYNINYRGHRFKSASPESVLALRMAPEGGCLWVLDEYDALNPYITEKERLAAAFSNSDVILPVGSQPEEEIFGEEPAHTWCYYYQKAELANQTGAWEAAIAALDTAQQQGLAPALSIEWLPLVQAHGMRAEWPQALEASQRTRADGPQADAILCALWAGWQAGAPPELYTQIQQEAECTP